MSCKSLRYINIEITGKLFIFLLGHIWLGTSNRQSTLWLHDVYLEVQKVHDELRSFTSQGITLLVLHARLSIIWDYFQCTLCSRHRQAAVYAKDADNFF